MATDNAELVLNMRRRGRKSFVQVLTMLLMSIVFFSPITIAQNALTPVTIEPEPAVPNSRVLINGVGTIVRATSSPAQVCVNAAQAISTIHVTSLPAPNAPTVTPNGTTGSMNYAYCIASRDATGNSSPASQPTLITNGNGIPSSSNFNAVSWTAVPSAASYDVYRCGAPINNFTVSGLGLTISPYALAATPDGSKIFATNYGSFGDYVVAIDASTNTVTFAVNVGGGPQAIAITPDGTKCLEVGENGGNMSVFTTSTGSVLRVAPIADFNTYCVAVSPDGTKAYVGGQNYLAVVDLSTYACTTLGSYGPIKSIAVSPDGSNVYFSGAQGLALTPDGRKAYTSTGSITIYNVAGSSFSNIGGSGGGVYAFDLRARTFLGNISVGVTPYGVAITPDGSKALVTNNSSSGYVSIITTSNNALSSPITVGAYPAGICVTPDGARTYVANSNPSGTGSMSVIPVPQPCMFQKIANTTSTSFNDQLPWGGPWVNPPTVPTNTVTLAGNAASNQLLDCSNGDITINLPDAQANSGKQFQFRRIDSSKHCAKLVGFGSQKVLGNLNTWTMFNKANPIALQSDGTINWRNISSTSAGKSCAVGGLPPGKTRGCTDWATDNMLFIGSDGKLYGWGLSTNGNTSGAINTGNEIVRTVAFDPVNPPAQGTYIVDWAANASDLFVVLSDGTVYGAGQNSQGQLGLGNLTATYYLKLITVNGGTPIIKVWNFDQGGLASQYGKTFFLTNTGALYACGYNANYALGIALNTTTPLSTPTLVPNIWFPKEIKSAHTIGGSFTLLCDATGALYVTGFNTNGQLGNGTASNVNGFTQTPSNTFAAPIIDIFPFGADNAGSAAACSCVLDANGVLYTAGLNGNGELGIGNVTATNDGWYQVASTQETLKSSCVTYNAGTVADTTGGTTITGTSTGWSTTAALATSLRIGFGSTNPASITTWYPITNITAATSLTVASSPGMITPGTSYVITSNPITNPVVDFVWSGYENALSAAALDSAGGLWTWGYNGNNNLFYSSTTTPRAAPTENVANAKIIGSTKTTNTGIVAANLVYWDGSKLHFSGSTVDGLVGIADSSFASGSSVVALPQSIATGAEAITDVFVNNNQAKARLFVLTDHGGLYSNGDNSSGVSSSGIAGPASVGIFKIRVP